MARAIWNGAVLAESETFETVEGSVYFPPETINKAFFRASTTTSFCPWKGIAHYYTVEVDGEQNDNAAWFYPDPTEAALNIKDHVAFWHGVVVED